MEKSRAIKVLKPLVNSFVDYANITMKEEDDNIVEALEMAVESLKAQLSKEGTTKDATSDLIDRQAVLDVLHGYFDGMLDTDTVCPADIYGLFECIPSAQPEPSIPLSWIENEIKWLKSLDNTFSEITALQISAMVNKWRDEQDE